MRSRFDAQLALLHRELIEMGALCEEAISRVSTALRTRDAALAQEIAAGDAVIDQKERSIESLCLKLLLEQQPVASDLRQVSAALKMITDMERIGDQAADVAEIACYLMAHPDGECAEIHKMAAATQRMVSESVDAFVRQDAALARQVIDEDDGVDDLFVAVKRALIANIAAAPQEGECALDRLMIAKYFERIGDHATNIAEWVVYSVTGQRIGGETE